MKGLEILGSVVRVEGPLEGSRLGFQLGMVGRIVCLSLEINDEAVPHEDTTLRAMLKVVGLPNRHQF